MPETIGQQLKAERERRNLSLKAVVDELHIREHYLLALEEDRCEEVLSPVQAKGFLRLYADFLGVNPFPSELAIPSELDNEASSESDSDEPLTNEPETESNQEEGFQESEQFLLGSQFKEARFDKDLSFEAIEKELHIGQNYLQAIETESFELLPQGIQARGMIQRYAEHLELDSDQILSEYADLLLNRQSTNSINAPKRKKAKKVDGSRQFLTTDVIIGLSLLAVIFVILFFSIQKVISTRNIDVTNVPTEEIFIASRTPTLDLDITPTNDDLAGTSVPGEIPTATLQVRPTNEAEGDLSSRVILQIIANQRAYLRITADGESAFDGRVIGGNFYEFYGEERIELLTGNAAALNITVIQDGRETHLGALGLVGQVVNLTFQPDVIITPTVTPSLTPTITNTPLPTSTMTTTPSTTPTED